MSDGHPPQGFGPWTAQPLSQISPEILPFWEHLKSHSFRIVRCTRCGTTYWPFTVCNKHDDIPSIDEMEWSEVSGRGTIFAVVVVERVQDEAYADEVPFALAMIELDEGPLFPSRIIDADPLMVGIGDRVEVAFVDIPAAGHTLPFFRPSKQ
jgi:uncharacterized OB-fold protein